MANPSVWARQSPGVYKDQYGNVVKSPKPPTQNMAPKPKQTVKPTTPSKTPPVQTPAPSNSPEPFNFNRAETRIEYLKRVRPNDPEIKELTKRIAAARKAEGGSTTTPPAAGQPGSSQPDPSQGMGAFWKEPTVQPPTATWPVGGTPSQPIEYKPAWPGPSTPPTGALSAMPSAETGTPTSQPAGTMPPPNTVSTQIEPPGFQPIAPTPPTSQPQPAVTPSPQPVAAAPQISPMKPASGGALNTEPSQEAATPPPPVAQPAPAPVPPTPPVTPTTETPAPAPMPTQPSTTLPPPLGENINRFTSAAGSAYENLVNRFNTSDPYQMQAQYNPVFTAEMERQRNRVMSEFERRNAEEFQRQNESTQLQIAERGLDPNSPAAQAIMKANTQRQDLMRQEALSAAEGIALQAQAQFANQAAQFGNMPYEQFQAIQAPLMAGVQGYYTGQESTAQREFQRGERVGTQQYQAEQSAIDRALQVTEAEKGRAFTGEQAEIVRRYESGEAAANKSFQAMQADIDRQFQSVMQAAGFSFQAQQGVLERQFEAAKQDFVVRNQREMTDNEAKAAMTRLKAELKNRIQIARIGSRSSGGSAANPDAASDAFYDAQINSSYGQGGAKPNLGAAAAQGATAGAGNVLTRGR
jgi:hypothetical protein